MNTPKQTPKETGILFQTDMVQAVDSLDKTETRRTRGLKKINENPDEWIFYRFDGLFFHLIDTTSTQCIALPSPYGLAGDLLWVRETFCPFPNSKPLYKANGCKPIEPYKWKPSIHMPKSATRLWLEIKEIKLERLHDIDELGASNEGVNQYRDYEAHNWLSARFGFQMLWEKINGEDSWKSNPWVWVVKFQKTKHKMP